MAVQVARAVEVLVEVQDDARDEAPAESRVEPRGRAQRGPRASGSPAAVPRTRTVVELTRVVESLAADPDSWMPRVRLRADRRWYERLHAGDDYDVWLISWLPGQSTGFHDHGPSAGAFAVALGTLEEHRPNGDAAAVAAGEGRSFGADYAHDVRNTSGAPAISIHAYSPPLTDMTHYDVDAGDLVPMPGGDGHRDRAAGSGRVRGIDEVLELARARLQRQSPAQAHRDRHERGALLIDIRPAAQRAAEGEIPGALIIERNVLEWRLDPASDARIPEAAGYDVRAIVFCSEGYTSSLAAAALQELGLWRATDIIGGFVAWRDAGLPVTARSDGRAGAHAVRG